jgi:GH25 family lysozyme M1 (1,4-beta-N-acetylmuramidase)
MILICGIFLRRVDILFGAFHWFIPWEDAIVQAEWFLRCAPEPGGLPYVVDVEDRRRVPAGYGEKVRKFCEWVTRESGQKTVIYTGAAYWNQFLGDADWAVEYPLWVANYKRAEGPLVPAPWYPGGWFAWQFTSSGKGARYGVQSKAVDLDVGNWVGS